MKRWLFATGLAACSQNVDRSDGNLCSAARALDVSSEFEGRDVQIIVPSFEPPQYTAARWWEKETEIVSFQNEILKYLYYRVKYWRVAD